MRRAMAIPAAIGLALGSCQLGRQDAVESSPRAVPRWEFEVRSDADSATLRVSGRFETGRDSVFEIDPATSSALHAVRTEAGRALEPVEGGYRLPEGLRGSGAPVRLSWEVDLGEAARSRLVQEVEGGGKRAWIAPAQSFLLRPVEGWRGTVARVRFVPGGLRVLTGMARAREPDTYAFPAARIDRLPHTVIGELAGGRVPVGRSAIDVAILPGRRAASDAELLDLVRLHAGAVAELYGRFPVDHALVAVLPSGRGGYGRTLGSGGASVLYFLDRRASGESALEDWVLVHELLHFACPLLPPENHWFEEGLSTYLEPIVRHRAGWLTAEEVWENFLGGLPNGLPRPGDRGLDRTRTWGRTYWGGALFCLLADVEIRRSTENRSGLRDAVRGIVEAGGSIEGPSSMARTLAAADAAIGIDVLVPLWEAMRDDPHPVDLEALWRELGVESSGAGVRFDDSAPLASVRRAIAGAPGRAPAPPAATRR